MTLTSRVQPDSARRTLAIVAGLALALALLPLAGTAQAQDPPPNAPCPEGTPEADFVDRGAARSTHQLSIDCVAFHAISVGSSDTEGNPVYLPAGIVNRAQMATFIANTLEAAGEELPDGGGDDEFTDISGTVHRERINALARAGIVSGRTAELYRPNLPVTRAQMATFIVQAAEYVYDEEFEGEDGPWFEDAIGSAHEANIDAGFEFGLFEGRVAPTDDTLGIFDTRSGTRRDQMATFLSRLLDFIWIEQGIFGAVIDAEDDEPIAGADVTITDEDDDVVVELTTGDSGLFLAELDAGTYDVTADAEGYETATETDVVVVEGEITDVILELTAEVVEPDPTATLTADRELAPASETADPGNDFPSRGDVNFELRAFDADGDEVTEGLEFEFTVTNEGDTEAVVACVRCADPQDRTIDPGDTETFEVEHVEFRERVRIDAAGATSVTVTGETQVDGVTVSDTATAEWVEVDEEPTGAGEEADFSGTIAAFHTGGDHEWYLIDAGEDDGYVYVEYTGGEDDTYLIEGDGVDLAAFEAALALDLDIDYENDDQDEQTHHLSPVGDGDNDNDDNG